MQAKQDVFDVGVSAHFVEEHEPSRLNVGAALIDASIHVDSMPHCTGPARDAIFCSGMAAAALIGWNADYGTKTLPFTG